VHHRPPPNPLFPYTTLFRSRKKRNQRFLFGSKKKKATGRLSGKRTGRLLGRAAVRSKRELRGMLLRFRRVGLAYRFVYGAIGFRSEEHTSELQSRFDLVCRL